MIESTLRILFQEVGMQSKGIIFESQESEFKKPGLLV